MKHLSLKRVQLKERKNILCIFQELRNRAEFGQTGEHSSNFCDSNGCLQSFIFSMRNKSKLRYMYGYCFVFIIRGSSLYSEGDWEHRWETEGTEWKTVRAPEKLRQHAQCRQKQTAQERWVPVCYGKSSTLYAANHICSSLLVVSFTDKENIDSAAPPSPPPGSNIVYVVAPPTIPGELLLEICPVKHKRMKSWMKTTLVVRTACRYLCLDRAFLSAFSLSCRSNTTSCYWFLYLHVCFSFFFVENYLTVCPNLKRERRMFCFYKINHQSCIASLHSPWSGSGAGQAPGSSVQDTVPRVSAVHHDRDVLLCQQCDMAGVHHDSFSRVWKSPPDLPLKDLDCFCLSSQCYCHRYTASRLVVT